MVERTFHPLKTRNIVEYTGKILEDCEVEKLGLKDDYCLTINKVADMLDLHITTVQTYIIPRLDVAVAGPFIRGYMNNPRLKRVVSKRSLIDFLGWYVDSVQYDCETYAISRFDATTDISKVSVESNIIIQISDFLGNKKKLQPFLNYASLWLEENCFSDYVLSKAEEKSRIDKCIYSILDNNIMSFNQVKKALKFKHNEQLKRWFQLNSHTKLVLKSLDTTGSTKRDNVRYILKNNINILDNNVVDEVDYTHGRPTYLNVFDKTKSALINLETEHPLYVSVLYAILKYKDDILKDFESWQKEKNEKIKLKLNAN